MTQITRTSMYSIAVAVACLGHEVFAGELPSETVVLSKTHPNKELIEAGFQPLKAELGESWQRVQLPPMPSVSPQDKWLGGFLGALVFKDKFFLTIYGEGENAAVWRLEENGRWVQVAKSLPAPPINTLVEHDGRIWATSIRPIGVHFSSDWETWTSITNDLPWDSYQTAPTLVSHGDSLFGIGGSKVWRYNPGRAWECTANAPPWGDLQGFAATSLNGRMFVFGGSQQIQKVGRFGSPRGYTASVWSSEDGVDWIELPQGLVPQPRQHAGFLSAKGRLWALGGTSGRPGFIGKTGFNLSDVWTSENGTDWVQIATQAAWSPRYGQKVLFWRERLYVVGGVLIDVPYHDIWVTSPVRMNADGLYYYEKRDKSE